MNVMSDAIGTYLEHYLPTEIVANSLVILSPQKNNWHELSRGTTKLTNSPSIGA